MDKMKYVLKKDKTIEPYDEQKIINAVNKSAQRALENLTREDYANICNEVFGESNFVSQLGWQKVYSPKNQARYFSNDYEFILCYSKNIEYFHVNLLPRTEQMNARYKNPDNDPRGPWKPGDCVGNGVRSRGYYNVIFGMILFKIFDSFLN